MRKTTNGHGLVGAVLTAVAVAVVMLLLTAALLTGYARSGAGGGLFTALVAVYALSFLAIGAGVLWALVQRWREVKGGEEDEAKRY